MKEIVYYKTKTGKCPFLIWLNSLDSMTLARIDSRLVRLSQENYGDFKKIESNIFELRFKFGSGYRIYYTEKNKVIIILLCAGDKKTQSKDIKKAKEYYTDLKGKQNG